MIAAFGDVLVNKDLQHIRIVNVSLGAAVYESYDTDFLTIAAKRLVEAGIIVVAAAGNRGVEAGHPQYGSVMSPGNAPWVLTVGASSHMGTAKRKDDTMAPFSSRGPSAVDYSDRLAGAVDVVGVSNFVTFLENTEDYRRDLRRAEYGDERDPAMRNYLESIAPANHAGDIGVPLFIIQGANDPRVPASESEQMLAAVRANETDAWYLLAKDEGHGFKKKSNQDYQREAVTMFLEEVLNSQESRRD